MTYFPLLAFLLLAVPLSYGLPQDFGFGSSTAAYQIEGGWLEDGKSMHEWDNLGHANFSEDGTNGDIAADSYHLYHQDVALMKEYGIKHFRMSVSWARIVPTGRAGTAVNMKGIEHYRKVFVALLEAGITPYVTLYHWDIPSYLLIVGDGYADPDFPEDFEYFADVCFRYFGDLVKHWFTFNEPWCTAAIADYEPQDKGTKVYRVTHNILLGHGRAAKIYHEKYQKTQHGGIGIVINSEYYYPRDPNKPADVDAAKRCLAFQLGWFADPIFIGDYPQVMKDRVGKRMPQFTEEEKKMLKGSADFFALNNYFSCIAYARNKTATAPVEESYWEDRNADTSYGDWNKTDNGWPIVPQGLHDLLIYIQQNYLKGTKMPIFITENGIVIDEKSPQESQADFKRIDFVTKHLKAVEQAIFEGANVTRYFYWSLIDDFEWGGGYLAKFGLTRVEFGKAPKRSPRGSLRWYARMIHAFGAQ